MIPACPDDLFLRAIVKGKNDSFSALLRVECPINWPKAVAFFMYLLYMTVFCMLALCHARPLFTATILAVPLAVGSVAYGSTHTKAAAGNMPDSLKKSVGGISP